MSPEEMMNIKASVEEERRARLRQSLPTGSLRAIEDAVEAAIEASRPAGVGLSAVQQALAVRWLDMGAVPHLGRLRELVEAAHEICQVAESCLGANIMDPRVARLIKALDAMGDR